VSLGFEQSEAFVSVLGAAGAALPEVAAAPATIEGTVGAIMAQQLLWWLHER